MKRKNYEDWSLEELVREQNYLRRLVSMNDEIPRTKMSLHLLDRLIGNKKQTLKIK